MPLLITSQATNSFYLLPNQFRRRFTADRVAQFRVIASEPHHLQTDLESRNAEDESGCAARDDERGAEAELTSTCSVPLSSACGRFSSEAACALSDRLNSVWASSYCSVRNGARARSEGGEVDIARATLVRPFLEWMEIAGGTTEAYKRNRKLLARAMSLPVLDSMTFPVETHLAGRHYNAKLCGQRVLCRSFNRFKPEDPRSGAQLSLYKYKNGQKYPFDIDEDAVDLFIFLLGDREDEDILRYVAVFPQHVLYRHGLLAGPQHRGIRQPYLTWAIGTDQANSSSFPSSRGFEFFRATGKRFGGLSSYFFEVNRRGIDKINRDSELGGKFEQFFHRILDEHLKQTRVSHSA
ncbi:unnamed protein product [Amoebophrya sp. A25]|nr:unnamed protein product [Amoebophrya sp. A25]|eukprot:GSA25T00023933001.1